jgi:mRNA-degrading endonuclease toxin of MazEF toxin-antitoxin module
VNPARGEIWRYQPVVSRPGIPALRLVVSSAGVNNHPTLPVVLAVQVVDSDPGGLLAVGVGEHGWATALTIEPVMRSRLVERMTVLGLDVMENVSTALRAAQDL